MVSCKEKFFSKPSGRYASFLFSRPFSLSLLFLYSLELLFNRTLMRTLIFIPPSSVRSALEFLTSHLGLLALNATLVLPLAGMFMGLGVLVGIVFLAGLVADFAGVFKIKYLLLLLTFVLTYMDRRMLWPSLLVALMVLSSSFTHLYLGWFVTILWALYPLPYIIREGVTVDRWTYLAVALASTLSVGLLANPYHVGQIFILAMGIVNPWMLPVALVTYGLSPRSKLASTLLLTGPGLQLSNQVLMLALFMMEEANKGLDGDKHRGVRG